MGVRLLSGGVRNFAIALALIAQWVPVATFGAEPLSIPFIERPPEIADFADMRPTSDIGRMMARVEGFVQREPDDGSPITQRTEVYIAYDERNLYAVFLAFDDEPQDVRANLSPRESIWDDDTVGLMIDTFNDQRTAYTFVANPLGVQLDGRWNESTNLDTSYEAVWHSDGRRTDAGYMVKFAIPFRTLRFPETGEQVWRIMFEREIARLGEEAYWPAYSIAVEGRLNQAAILTGVRNVSPGRNIQLIPFAFIRDFDVLDPGAPGFNDDTEDDFGLDAKFVFGDSMVLDATINPDFSQVESDEPQVTVNERFEVLFPERRPFFLENADYFSTGTNLVFTRRIQDPSMGLRFTGKQGPWSFGTMLMDDEAPGRGVSPADPLHGESAQITVLRVFRDVGEQSSVGLLSTDRDIGDRFNKVASVDGRIKLTPNWTSQIQFVNSDTRLEGGEEFSGRHSNVRFDRSGRHVNAHAHWIDTSEGFHADLAFLGRNDQPDSQSTHGRAEYRFWPESSGLNSWGPTVFLNHVEDQSGTRIYSQIRPELTWRWAADTELSVQYHNIRERLRPQDFPRLSRNRDYPQDLWTLSFETETFSKVSLEIELESGTAINLDPLPGAEPELADTIGAELGLTWRPFDRLRIDTTYLYTELEGRAREGEIFTDQILRTRWNYQFTKELSLRFIAQYEETDPGLLTSLEHEENLNLDMLLRYVINPWSALYVGYNSNSSNFALVDTEDGRELIRSNGLDRDGEQLFVKFSYLLQP